MNRILILSLLLCLCHCTRTPGDETLQRFEQAQVRFQEAKTPQEFLDVAATFEAVLEEAGDNGGTFYNLGNAYFRADEKGRAIAAYRQAQRLRPNDPRLDANLRLALRDSSHTLTRSSMDTLFFWRSWLGYAESWAFATGLVMILAALLSIGIVFKPARALTSRLMWGVIPLVIIYLASLGYSYYQFEVVQHGVVVAKEVQARKGNSESYEPAFTEPLQEGAEFRVLESQGGWVRAQLGKNLDGWLPTGDVVIY